MSKVSLVFFGSSNFSIYALEALKNSDMLPRLIVTTPDRPKGRGLLPTLTPTKIWAKENNVTVLTPEKLDTSFLSTLHVPISFRKSRILDPLKRIGTSPSDFVQEIENPRSAEADRDFTLFIVSSYGKILPASLLQLPSHGTLNIHPSLLPKLRGPSPIQSAILEGAEKTGVTIMLMDQEMDHGPILAKQELEFSIFNDQFSNGIPTSTALQKKLGEMGAKLLVETIPKWLQGKIEATPQNHNAATYSKKITKEDGLLDLSADPYKNFLKTRALDGWPGTYFFAEKQGKKIRVIIKEASFQNVQLKILRVLPEGKKEISYEQFTSNYR